MSGAGSIAIVQAISASRTACPSRSPDLGQDHVDEAPQDRPAALGVNAQPFDEGPSRSAIGRCAQGIDGRRVRFTLAATMPWNGPGCWWLCCDPRKEVSFASLRSGRGEAT
jgi:hypothetical protein